LRGLSSWRMPVKSSWFPEYPGGREAVSITIFKCRNPMGERRSKKEEKEKEF